MTVPLLTTKFYMPRPPAEHVRRGHLIEGLNAGIDGKLTLISAPAGFGKTTLASMWMGQQGCPVAWLSLDKEDNDPVRFLGHFIGAMRSIHDPFGADFFEGNQTFQASSLKHYLVHMVNELAEITAPYIFSFDDYHAITNVQVHEITEFLVQNAPPQMHIVLTTRADPPWPLSRMRARGEVTELRAADLRFSHEEIDDLLNRIAGLRLSMEDIAALETRTEGWVSGLHLAALSLQGKSDPSGFVKSLSGSNRFILDYLVEEVLALQPPHVQDFLVRTSILARLTAPLCNALVDRTDSQEILSYLERGNLFITALDEERRWYRYHHLFADFLRTRLEQSQPETFREMHGQASQACEDLGLMFEAVNHALAIQDYERGARLSEENALAIIMRGELTTLLSYHQGFPEEIRLKRPWLNLYHAWAQIFAGNLAEVESLIVPLEKAFQRDHPDRETREILGNIAGMRAFMADMRGNPSKAISYASLADELLPKEGLKSPVVLSVVPFTLGRAYRLEGEMSAASEQLEKVARIGLAANSVWTYSVGMYEVAAIRKIQGRLREAEKIFLETLEEIRTHGIRMSGTVAKIDAGMADLLRERNQLPEAERLATQSIRNMRRWQSPGDLVIGYLTLARVMVALGRLEEANDAMQNALELKREGPLFPPLNSMIDTERVKLWLYQGELADAEQWARESNPGEHGSSLSRELQLISLSRVRIAQGNMAEALSLLSKLAAPAEKGGRDGRLIEIFILMAIAQNDVGEMDRALQFLERTLEIGQPEGYMRVFLDEGTSIESLLQKAISSDIHVGYANKLLGAIEMETVQQPHPSPLTPMAEPLSERELQVLRLLPTHMKTPEMADELFLSVNTVRSHIKSIYGKLGVHQRSEAVQKAREIGLL